jgi:predicted membrane protein DUF2232
MFRRLTAIEIAEGALMADIGVIFQLLVKILPVGGGIFHLLIPIVFAVIVLRRSFYVGCMSLVVALFITVLISGPGSSFFMLLECGAGLFLGLTMKHRMRHFVILFLGVTSGTITFYLLLIVLDFITGFPLSNLVLSVQLTYKAAVGLAGAIAALVGGSNWWQHTALPPLNSIANLAFSYWWITYYVINWVFLIPVVIVIYYFTNRFVRLLGYQVRPFPGGKIEDLLYWILRKLTRLIPKAGIGKHWIPRTLNREVRRLGLARQKSKT